MEPVQSIKKHTSTDLTAGAGADAAAAADGENDGRGEGATWERKKHNYILRNVLISTAGLIPALLLYASEKSKIGPRGEACQSYEISK